VSHKAFRADYISRSTKIRAPSAIWCSIYAMAKEAILLWPVTRDHMVTLNLMSTRVGIGKTRNCVETRRPKGGVFSHNFEFSQFPRVSKECLKFLKRLEIYFAVSQPHIIIILITLIQYGVYACMMMLYMWHKEIYFLPV
jgi:hypothetical protein